jgi:type II secretory pathway pseudopilin PulG
MLSFTKQRGIGLLEVMLVIAVMGVIIVSGLSLYQTRTRDFFANKTALQMQEWLQAAMAYYSDHGGWPSGADPLKTLVVANYMPSQDGMTKITNPWGQEYTATIKSTPGQGNGNFIVSTVIPTTAEVKENYRQALATQIAAHLPTGTSISSSAGYTITAATPPPAGGNSNPSGIIGVTYLENGAKWTSMQTQTNPCPAGQQLQVFTGINTFTGWPDVRPGHFSVQPIYSIHTDYNVTGNKALENDVIDVNHQTPTPLSPQMNERTLAIAACVQSPSTMNSSTLKNLKSNSQTSVNPLYRF